MYKHNIEISDPANPEIYDQFSIQHCKLVIQGGKTRLSREREEPSLSGESKQDCGEETRLYRKSNLDYLVRETQIIWRE